MPPGSTMPNIPGTNRFNTQLILWSEDGEILNKQALGGRFSQLTNLTLSTENLDSIQSFSIDDQSTSTTEDKLLFRSITTAAPSNNLGVSYIQVLANTNQIKNAMSNDFDFIDGLFLDFVDWYQLFLDHIEYAANLGIMEKAARVC